MKKVWHGSISGQILDVDNTEVMNAIYYNGKNKSRVWYKKQELLKMKKERFLSYLKTLDYNDSIKWEKVSVTKIKDFIRKYI